MKSKEIIIINKSHPYINKKHISRPDGMSEFVSKIHKERKKWYLYMFVTDKYVRYFMEDNIYLFKIYVGYLSALHDFWKKKIIKSINNMLDTFQFINSSAHDIYYHIITSYITYNDYWPKCKDNDCIENGTYCQGAHGKKDEDNIEVESIGQLVGNFHEGYEWARGIKMRRYELTDEFYDIIEDNKDIDMSDVNKIFFDDDSSDEHVEINVEPLLLGKTWSVDVITSDYWYNESTSLYKFDTINDFWRLINNIKPLSELPYMYEYLFSSDYLKNYKYIWIFHSRDIDKLYIHILLYIIGQNLNVSLLCSNKSIQYYTNDTDLLDFGDAGFRIKTNDLKKNNEYCVDRDIEFFSLTANEFDYFKYY